MNHITRLTLLLMVISPWLGLCGAICCEIRKKGQSVVGLHFVKSSMLVGTLSASVLGVILSGLFGDAGIPRIPFATIFQINGPHAWSVTWGWRAEPLAAWTVAAMNAMGYLALSQQIPHVLKERGICFSLAACALIASASSCVLSEQFIQMFFFWGTSALAMRLLTIQSLNTDNFVLDSTRMSDSDAASRFLLATLVIADAFLGLGVVLLTIHGSTLSMQELVSVEGLSQLNRHNPQLTLLILRLILTGLIGRSGLFPFFEWHAKGESWPRPVWMLVVGVGTLPLSFWITWQMAPLFLQSENSRSFLKVIGIIGALIGAFVSVCQARFRTSLSFAVSAQLAVIWIAMADFRIMPRVGDQFLSSPHSLERFVLSPLMLAQSAVAIAFIRLAIQYATKRNQHSPRSSISIVRNITELGRERLYLDHVVRDCFSVSARLLNTVSMNLESQWKDVIGNRFITRVPAWFSEHLDTTLTGNTSFEIIAIIATISTVLLTVVLVS